MNNSEKTVLNYYIHLIEPGLVINNEFPYWMGHLMLTCFVGDRTYWTGLHRMHNSGLMRWVTSWRHSGQHQFLPPQICTFIDAGSQEGAASLHHLYSIFFCCSFTTRSVWYGPKEGIILWHWVVGHIVHYVPWKELKCLSLYWYDSAGYLESIRLRTGMPSPQ